MTLILLITLGSLVAYIAGLILLVRIRPSLLKHAFDEALFIGFAAVAVFGGMLVFGGIGITFAIFSGVLGVRIFDGLLLLILGVIMLRTSVKAFRPGYNSSQRADRISRVMVGSFFLLLAIAAVALLGLLFVPAT